MAGGNGKETLGATFGGGKAAPYGPCSKNSVFTDIFAVRELLRLCCARKRCGLDKMID